MKKKTRHVSKLGIHLIIAAEISLIAGIAVFLTAYYGGYALTGKYITTDEYYEKHTKMIAEDYQEYIKINNISSAELEKLESYEASTSWYVFGVYKNDKLIYSTVDFFEDTLHEEQDSYSPNIFPLRLSDGMTNIVIYADFEARFYTLTDITGILLGCLTFAVLFIMFIRKKIKYVNLLESEMRILEGGYLTFNISVEGNDELSELARSINDMRNSIIDRQINETKALRANKNLITSMSHDLRTPLTSLMGYIELIQNGKYENEEQLHHFIDMCYDKTLRMKEMSDRLFTFSQTETETELNMTDVDSFEFYQQVLSDMIYELENDGFSVEYSPSAFDGTIHIDADEYVRVFENMTSNIKKYADKTKNVVISCSSDSNCIVCTVENSIEEKPDVVSTGIGIKTCIRILEKHGGKFSVNTDGKTYESTIKLPVKY